MVVSTVLLRGSITLMVFESSLQMNTRSSASIAAPRCAARADGPRESATAPTAVALSSVRRDTAIAPDPPIATQAKKLNTPVNHTLGFSHEQVGRLGYAASSQRAPQSGELQALVGQEDAQGQ